MQLIKQLVNCNSTSPSNAAVQQLAKAAESTMHEVSLLRHQMTELRAANKKQKQKHTVPRSFCYWGGSNRI
jgi:hypothetical protein